MGDPVAASLLDQAAHALATLAAAVQRQLFGEGDHCTIHYTGGMFSSAPMLARFQMLCELSGAARVLPPALGPAHGALLEAQRIARAA
jgi:N-acetylglucosamine kinase-like BadF-type ATPase